uniref:Amidohydrolase-related domain-containing protein n=1 Tax=Ignisphaera aggregans TaxID=334771 RepID=A0A7C5UWI6_9CREN
MNLTLHQCRYIISSYSPLKILEDSDIVIDNGRVVCLGQCYGYRGYDKVDCKEKVVAPAFGNAHIHLYTILKVINEQNPYRALLIAILNMAANGIAAFQSMDENYKTVVEAAKSIGLRVKAGPIIKNKKCDEYISIEKLGYRLYTPIISIENLLEVDEEVLESCIELLLNRNIDIQISVSRTIEETLKFKRIKKLFPVEYLVKKNLLSNKIILTHINWISSWELESIVYYRPRVVVCPYSDALSNINGLPPLKKYS